MFNHDLGDVQSTEQGDKIYARIGSSGHVVYGPYTQIDPGMYEVSFSLGLADGHTLSSDPICATIDVVTNQGTSLICQRLLRVSDIAAADAFTLAFKLYESRELEYRVHSSGQAELVVGEPYLKTIEAWSGAILVAVPLTGQDRITANEREFLDGYLRNVTGILHIGANIGQEREYYRLLGVDVVWVEPIKEIYDRLVNNIANCPKQRAICALLTDMNDQEVVFRIANNNGASSSILPMDRHAAIFPGIDYVEERRLKSTTLASLMNSYNISSSDYQALTMDVEGAEMLVLKGAGAALSNFKYVKAEVADFSSRVGSALTSELEAFMEKAGFVEIIRRPFAFDHETGGTAWDVVWGRGHDRSADLAPVITPPDDVGGMDKVHHG